MTLSVTVLLVLFLFMLLTHISICMVLESVPTGEAFDKTARLLGVSGGAELESLAAQGTQRCIGLKER